jgi:hypothetical protein
MSGRMLTGLRFLKLFLYCLRLSRNKILGGLGILKWTPNISSLLLLLGVSFSELKVGCSLSGDLGEFFAELLGEGAFLALTFFKFVELTRTIVSRESAY